MTDSPEALASRTRAIYERHAVAFDQHRHRVLIERPWLDRLLELSPAGSPVLDVGCGAGDPVARYFADAGRSVTGVDFAQPMLDLARNRLPEQRWVHADMRTLDLGERFGAVIAWDSFFHLTPDEQRTTLPRLAEHVGPGGALLFTCGPGAGEVTGTVEGDAVYHGSLDPHEYATLLANHGLRLRAFVAEDRACDLHTLCLAHRPEAGQR